MQTNLEKRKSRPQSFGGIIGGLLEKFGGRASDSDLIKRWDEIVGADISKIAKLVGIKKSKTPKKFNITIKPANAAFALQLSYQSSEIQKCVNKYFGYEAVEKITIRK